MRRMIAGWLAGAVLLAAGGGPAATAGLVGLEKQILPVTKQAWVAFRNYDGKQWIYFTHLVVYRCGLSEIRYSIGSAALDQTFPLPHCDPANPNAIDPVADPPYVTLPLGTAASIAVQVVYEDGEESEIVRLAPCDVTGEQTCAVLLE
ncbi:MAG: hypothetical protein ACTSP2_00295 [Alphaproteobacteria bacterium]